MSEDVWVLLVEEDYYARDLMALLLIRDWRTRVAGEVDNEDDLLALLQDPTKRVDAVLLDTEVPGDPSDSQWAFHMAELIRTAVPTRKQPAILFTGVWPNQDVLTWALTNGNGGYILKGEIRYALVTAVVRATRGNWVTTVGVQRLARQCRIPLPPRTLILDGTKPVARFTSRESEVARLAILFGQTRRDVADELLIQPGEVGKLVSRAYDKLGLNQILSGEEEAELYFQEELVIRRFQEAWARARRPAKDAREKVSLAFHLLTVPDEDYP
jgi:DNA-binding NarL/FixJ family response regulator